MSCHSEESGEETTLKPHLLKPHRMSDLLIGTMFLLFSGCVAVNLGPGKPTKSETVRWQAPQDPFVEIKNRSVDRAWKNKNNGNTVAFLSECKTAQDSPLKSLEAETLSVLENNSVTSSEEFDYNDRQAIHTLAQGQVDGVNVQMETLIFKKNNIFDSFLIHFNRQLSFH